MRVDVTRGETLVAGIASRPSPAVSQFWLNRTFPFALLGQINTRCAEKGRHPPSGIDCAKRFRSAPPPDGRASSTPRAAHGGWLSPPCATRPTRETLAMTSLGVFSSSIDSFRAKVKAIQDARRKKKMRVPASRRLDWLDGEPFRWFDYQSVRHCTKTPCRFIQLHRCLITSQFDTAPKPCYPNTALAFV